MKKWSEEKYAWRARSDAYEKSGEKNVLRRKRKSMRGEKIVSLASGDVELDGAVGVGDVCTIMLRAKQASDREVKNEPELDGWREC